MTPIRLKKIFTLGLMAFTAMTMCARAAVINIVVGPDGEGLQNAANGGASEMSLASNQFYSSIVGSKDNSRNSNFAFLQGVINNWNGANNTPVLPGAVNSGGADDNGSIGSDVTLFTVPAGHDYVVFHFGNGDAGEQGSANPDEDGWWAAWYLGGASFTFALPREGNPLENVGGFSSARYFDAAQDVQSVPDGGSSLMLLGAALCGLAIAKKKLDKRA